MREFFGLRVPARAGRTAVKVAGIYAILGGLWVHFSDRILLTLVEDPVLLTRLQTAKGWIFILVSAVLILWLFRHYLQQSQRMSEKIREIAEGVSVATDKALFASLTRSFAQTMEFDCVFLCELTGPGNNSLRSLSAYADGVFIDDFECLWAGTPCEQVFQRRRQCIFPANVRQQFSHPMLDRFEAESFVGTPLFDSEGHALGIMVLMDRKPLRRPELAGDLLQIFATRAAVELERIRISEALRESENRYRTVFEHNGASILIIEEDTTISMANQEFASLYGAALDDIEGRLKWPEFVADEDRERMLGYHYQRRIDPSAPPRNYDFHFISRDGRHRIIYATVAMIPETTQSVVALWDITERKMAEKEKARLAAIVESSDDAIIGKSLEGKIFSWNPGAERLYGYSASEVKGKHFSILVPPDHAEEVARIEKHIREGGKVAKFETTRLRKDGREIRVFLTVSPIRDNSGRIIGASTIAREI